MENGKLSNSFSAFSDFRFFAALRLGVLISVFASGILAQDLPGEIRGYKVHTAKIRVQNQIATNTDFKDADVIVRLDDPAAVPAAVSITGSIAFEISGEIQTLKQSGRVDFLMFRNFRVNGLPVEIEEYRESFEFKKSQFVKFPKPVKVYLGITQAMRGALQEWRESKDVWQVTGRVFVFGRFKKFGLDFKRVVPVDINLQIRNPLNSYQ